MLTSLQDYPWEVSYKTSGTKPDGSPVDILHDFYIPVLERSIRYDRVAGYFRSTSLAVASQGFSAFVANDGKVRLIVGCDLDPADVAVVLNHGKIEGSAIEKQMVGEVTGDGAWPEDVRRGVELLGWMLQLGRLEIRVAFRVHKETGKPIAADATQDGYVHEKWALFHGFNDECLLIEGSLNESRQALERNAENLSVHCEWWSPKHKEAVDGGKRDFERLWKNDHPCFVVHTIPEAARQELLRLGNRVTIPLEIDGSTAQPPPVEPPTLRERLQFALLRDAPKMPNGKFVGLYTSPVEPWPHQEVVAQRLIRSWPFNHMLCDEVGLGKTIEAGLAIRSLHLCGLAERVLIAAPASLCLQWQREMASKFLLPFVRATSRENEWIFPEKISTASPALFEENLSIVSTAMLTRVERQNELKGAKPFDIALVDEAHYARRSNLRQDDNERIHPKFNRLLATISECLAKKTDCLWLATATPMQLDKIEIADLISVTGRVGSFQFDPSLTQSYYDVLAKLVRESDPTKDEWEFLRRSILHLKVLDPLLWDYLDHAVVDAPIRNAVNRWLERGNAPRGTDRNRIRRYVFAASPLARVMLRHTRKLLEVYRANGELGANLARRTILQLPDITFTTQEKQAYDLLEEYCDGLKKQIEKNTRDSGKRVAMGFYLSFLRLRFASSLHAIRETVRRRRIRVLATLNKLEEDGETSIGEDGWRLLLDSDDEREELEAIDSVLKDRSEADLRWELEQLEKMVASLEDLSGMPSKMKELLRRIDKRRDKRTHRVGQMVIFSRFFDTVSAIRDRLRSEDPHMLIGTYSGQGAGGQYVDPKTGKLVNVDRELVKQRFVRGEIDILVCTDAAAEGLNLQTADLLVNYDLPWNPMKVEQRIGRIDRIGQKHEDIYVLNLAYPESAEEIVYNRLLGRLQSAGMVVGEQQFSLLPVTLDEFRGLAEGTLTSNELESRATIRLETQRIREQSTQIPADELYQIYHRLAREFRATHLPATLSEIENALLGSDYLRRIGCVATEEPSGERWLAVNGLAGIPDGSRLTVSRNLYGDGLPDGTSVRFASYGDPVLHAIFDHMLADEFPPCVRRLEVRVDENIPSLVGYLVATVGDGLRLLRSFRDLNRLAIDEDYTITDEEAAPFIRELEHNAASEWGTHSKSTIIEAINTKAAKAQATLNLMIARDLLTQKAKLSGETQFWPLLNQLYELANTREQLAIAQLSPLSLLQSIEPDLLFEVTAPVMGDHGHMTAPRLLVRAAIDAVCRITDSLNLKKGETPVERVLGRLERETRNQQFK